MLAPSCGYEIRVTDDTGAVLLDTDAHPVTGIKLNLATCIEVAAMYGDGGPNADSGTDAIAHGITPEQCREAAEGLLHASDAACTLIGKGSVTYENILRAERILRTLAGEEQ